MSCDLNNKTRQIPHPLPKPSPCTRNTLNPYPKHDEDPTGYAANVPYWNPGSPNPLPGHWDRDGYHGFPHVPVDSFVP